MRIVYDDIIYSLQRSGGGSVYWTEVIRPTLDWAEHYVYSSAKENIFYNQIKMQHKHMITPRCFLAERFINPRYGIKDPYIFHSSYFRYSRDRKAINITTVHDFTVEKFGHSLHSKGHIIQQRMAVRHSHGVICVSENTKNDFFEYYPWYKGEVTVIPNGYDEKAYYFESDIKKTNSVLFVGARTGYKRFEAAVQIVAGLRECKLVIVGGGELSDAEKNMLESCLHGRYEKKGYVSNEELRAMYNSAFFLCYPSEYEGFGIPLLEAQACGCPVLCQRKSSIPEVVKDSAIFIDCADMKRAVESARILYRDDVYSDYQLRGLENVKGYSWEKSAMIHQAYYEKMWEKFVESKQ